MNPFHWLASFSRQASPKKRSRRQSHRGPSLGRSLQFEPLEDRTLLTTLFLDFGGGINGSIATTMEGFRNVNGIGMGGQGTGSDLTQDSSPYVLTDPLEFLPLNYDFDGVNGVNHDDIVALGNAVLPIVRRIVEPFDIAVEIASAASLADVVTTLAANGDDPTGEFDAYSFVVTALSGTSSVGATRNAFGFAARDDLTLQLGNRQDEAAVTFADNVLAELLLDEGVPPIGSPEFNDMLVHRLAYTATHEAFHTFGFHHTFGGIADGDVIATNAADPARDNPTIVTRFDLLHFVTGTSFSNYDFIADDPDIGLRDDDLDGVPNLAYVTGTGLNDRITLTRDATNLSLVHVTVEGHNNTTFTPASLIATETYEINLLTDTEGEILIDSSDSSDLIEIDARIAASFRIRGNVGDDQVVLIGNGESAVKSFFFDGEKDNDTLTLDFENGDPLPQAGFDFNFIGGPGTDNTFVVDPTGVQRTGYFVNTLTDAADISVGNGRADSNAATDDQTTLRAAVQEANFSGTPTYIFVPQGNYNLTLTGTGGDTQGDLDITGNVTLVGAGAGLSIIEVDPSLADRHLEVTTTGKLEISRLTLTGGTAQTMGGSIHVADNANAGNLALTLNQVAVVNNSSSLLGGAIYVGMGSKALIERSVITNDSAYYVGGGIAADALAEVTLSATIVAKNSTTLGDPDLYTDTNGKFLSLGHNLIGAVGTADYTPHATDYVSPTGTVDHVVTSLVDSFDHTDDDHALSLREAIDLANANDNTLEEIWAPAWNFVLTRDRATFGGGNPKDIDIAFGDFDITDKLKVRGVSALLTTVRWEPGVVDEVFDLNGDYDGNGMAGSLGDVDGRDFFMWQQFQPSADGDDDGDVDGEDRTIWDNNYGNTLALTNLTVILS